MLANLTRLGGIRRHLPAFTSIQRYLQLFYHIKLALLHTVTFCYNFFLDFLVKPLLHTVTFGYILLHIVTICLVRPPCEAHKKRADGKGVNQNHQPYVVVGRKEESPTHRV